MGDDTRALDERDPLKRFTARAQSYAAFRPSYPPGLIDAVLEGLGEPAALRIADIGAGTGISARLLADRGSLVYAVEPNAAMRNAASAHERVLAVDGTAERTGLADASVDLVTAFQAYHWFDPEPTQREFARVLVPGGRVALVWNVRDDSDPFTGEYGELIRAAAVDREVERRHGAVESFLRDARFTNGRRLEVVNFQRLDLAGLSGRVESTSYVPHAGPIYERLLAGIRRLHARYADREGYVALAYRAQATLGETAPR
ncbi:methyltransferase domain-containing protein [bacterium]|nr:MAG: methyltransferase domain-containing protein [bacterium]